MAENWFPLAGATIHQIALLIHQSAGSKEQGQGGLGLEFWDAMELPISEWAIIGEVMSDRQSKREPSRADRDEPTRWTLLDGRS